MFLVCTVASVICDDKNRWSVTVACGITLVIVTCLYVCAGNRVPPQPHPRPSRHRRAPPPPEEDDDVGELPPSPPRHSPPPPAPEPRLSQLFDRLSHLTELTHNLHSPPASPRLLPRRPRAQPPSPPTGNIYLQMSTKFQFYI